MRPSHLGDEGAPRMVDVGAKPITARRAVAAATVRMRPDVLATLLDSGGPKGDAFVTARLAGIGAAKRTAELIPLCHPLGLDLVTVDAELDDRLPGVRICATAKVTGRTGVEMEALTAAAVACLTVYDMVKAVDRGMVIEDVRLVSKTGGTRGDWPKGESDAGANR
jgi:cyclic pyranopterin monophosphate synthase